MYMPELRVTLKYRLVTVCCALVYISSCNSKHFLLKQGNTMSIKLSLKVLGGRRVTKINFLDKAIALN